MMAVLKKVLTVAVLAASVAGAEPSIVVNSVAQRYPWNGIVDVKYTVSGLDTTHSYKLRFKVTTPSNVTKSFVADTPPTANGTFTSSFDAAGAFPNTLAKNCSLVASLIDLSVGGALPSDATGTPIGTSKAVGDVMVIDVSGGPDATTYPVTYCDDVDMGCFNCSVYKTDKIVLRWVEAGSYKVGHSIEGTINPRRTLTTKGFYIGVFSVTQKQYWNVTGDAPSRFTTEYPDNPAAERPVECVSWEMLRDSASPDVTPAASASGGFLARLQAKAKYNGVAVGGFDLPTEFQWEIACRAGKTTMYYWGDTYSVVFNYVWYEDNATMPHDVGRKLPNAWGLYDCCGNVREWCRDAWVSESNPVRSSPLGDNADICSTYGAYRVIRGGAWGTDSGYCTPSLRDYDPPSFSSQTAGFRLFRALQQ